MYSCPILLFGAVDSGFALWCSAVVLINGCPNLVVMFSQILCFLHVADICCSAYVSTLSVSSQGPILGGHSPSPA